MDIKQVEKLFVGKLGMQATERKRHKQYVLRSDLGDSAPLLSTICVNRDANDLAKNNVSGISDVLCMSFDELGMATKCEIGASMCILGMAVAILVKAKIEIDNDPITNDWDSSLLIYLPNLLDEAHYRAEVNVGKRDLEFAQKLLIRINSISEGAKGKFGECLGVIYRALNGRVESVHT